MGDMFVDSLMIEILDGVPDDCTEVRERIDGFHKSII